MHALSPAAIAIFPHIVKSSSGYTMLSYRECVFQSGCTAVRIKQDEITGAAVRSTSDGELPTNYSTYSSYLQGDKTCFTAVLFFFCSPLPFVSILFMRNSKNKFINIGMFTIWVTTT